MGIFSGQLACGVGYLWPVVLRPVVGMLKILRAVIGTGQMLTKTGF
jgi:hypothetical protein